MPTPNFWNSFRTSRWFKPAIAAVIVVVVLILGLLAVPMLIDINTYRGQIVSQLEQTLGRKVKLGTLGLRVFPSVKVKVDEVAIGDDPQFATGDFVKAKSVRLDLGLWSLIRGNPQVSGIELIEPNVTLIKTTPDKWNWSTLKPLQESKQESAQPPFNLLITNGSFNLIDRSVNPQVEKNYTGVNVALDDFSQRKSFDFVIGLTMPGEKAGKLEFKGEAGPIDSKDSAQTPIDARMVMDQVELSSLETLFGMQSGHSGKLTMDAELAGKMTEGLNASGTIKAEQLRLIAGVEPAKQPLEATFKLTAKSEKKADGQSDIALKIDRGDVKLGNTAASVTGQINRLPSQPVFDLQLKGDRMALDSLLESAYAFGFGPPPGTKASGSATVNIRAKGEQDKLALNGQAEIRDLKFQNPQLPQAIQISELKLNADPQAITATPFRATLSRTTVDFRGLKISDYLATPRAHLEISTSNGQLDDLLKIAESFGARPDMTGSGSANLSATIDTELGEKAASTQITGQGKLSGARVQPSSLKKPLEVANADLAFTGDSARIDNLQAQLGSTQANGWMQVKNFNQPVASFDLKANQLNVTEIQGLINEGGSGGQGQKSSSSSMRADGQIWIGRLVMDTLTATDVQSKIAMANNVITLNPLTMKLYGGNYQGSLRVDQNPSAADVSVDGKFGGLNINQFLSASGKGSSIYGTASGSIDVRGRNEPSGLARTLNGNGYVAISDGKFASFDLMKQVEVLGKLLSLPTGGAATAFRSLKTNLRFDQGKMTTAPLELIMDDMQVTGSGWMQLGDNPTVNYDLLARLSQDLSKRVMPGSNKDSSTTTSQSGLGIGLSMIVGNFFMDRGAIAVPIKMSGALSQPAFGLNANLLQARAQERLKEGLKESLLDQFTKKPDEGKTDEKKTDEQKPADKKPADLLKGVLDKLRKKEKP
ncbi:MAG: AsmA family protein [Blastocatellales bacterium]